LTQVEKLVAAIEREQRPQPRRRSQAGATQNEKLLAAIVKSAFETIPADPTAKVFRQGNTLGEGAENWFRDILFNGRYRLFFRYQSGRKIIVLAWVNDSSNLRTYGSPTDAYAVFRKMLERGNPPNNWQALLDAVNEEKVRARLGKIRARR
jgi:toxin YhaV